MGAKVLLAGLGLAVLMSACSIIGDSSVPRFHQVLQEATGQNGRACVKQRDIRGFGVLDHDVISIDGRGKYYLATVLPGCNTLSTSPRAVFEEHFADEVCGGGTSKVHAGGDHCTIRHIFEFDDRKAAFEAHERAQREHEKLKAEAEE